MAQATKNKKAVLLLSGGLDSIVAGISALNSFKIPIAITIDYGQPASKQEIKAAKTFCKKRDIKHLIIKTPWYKNLAGKLSNIPKVKQNMLDGPQAKKIAKKVWFPQRNLLFLAIAASIAEGNNIGTIIAGFNSEEGKTFPDNSQKFINSMQKTLNNSSFTKIKLKIPTANWDKTKILKHGLKLGLEPKEIWSCYSNNKIMCGSCESCMRLMRAAKEVGALSLFKGTMKWKSNS